MSRRYRLNGNFSTGGESFWTELRASDSYKERVLPETLPIYHRNNVSLGQTIAEGGQAIIYEARLASSYSFEHEPVAVKKFKNLVGISQGHFPRKLWEYRCLHVCKPRGVFFDYDGESLCVVMDRYSSDLRYLIDSQMKGDGPPFPEPVAVSIITQIALGLEGLHECGIYHRDLKASNILVQKSPNSLGTVGALDINYTVVIADFEASEDVKGTGFWRAPEVLHSLQHRVRLSTIQWQPADVYSFSMTCYEILTGKIPFDGVEWSNYEVVLSGKRPELPAYVGEPLRTIIQRCWDPVPTSRPNISDMLLLLNDIDKHSLITPSWNRMKSMIQLESSLCTPEAVFRELVRQAGTYTRALENESQRCRDNSKWASKFIRTVEQFASKFGWDSFSRHPSLPFAQHVERRRFLTLMTMQLEGYATMEDSATEMRSDNDVLELMMKVHNTIFEGYWQSEYRHEDDRYLTLDEKLAIVEQVLVEPLMHAKVCNRQILAVAVMAFQDLLRAKFVLGNRVKIETFCLHIQSRLEAGPELRMKCLQETLNDQGLTFLTQSMYLSSIVSTFLRLVVAYNSRLFADLPSAGFRRCRESFIGYVGLRFVFQCILAFLIFKLLRWRGFLVWFVGDALLGVLSDLRWRFRGLLSLFWNTVLSGYFRTFHLFFFGLPVVAYLQQLDKTLEKIVVIFIFFLIVSM